MILGFFEKNCYPTTRESLCDIDINKVKPRARMQHFLSQAFKYIILQFGVLCC